MEKTFLKKALQDSWDIDTAIEGEAENLMAGQSPATALVVQDILGGDILRTDRDGEWHFYNMEQGVRYDYVAEEIGCKIDYEDVLTDRDDILNIDTVFEKYALLKQRVIKKLKEKMKNK